MTTRANVAAPARPRLVTRPLLVRFVSLIGTATGFYLLLSAVPLYARSAGATMAVGIIVTFLPLAVTRADANVAALALLVQPAAAIAGRWLAGRHGDRPGGQQRSSALLVPGVLAAAAGVLALSLTAVPAAVIAGAAVFGLGFDVGQNVTQTVMYDRVPESAYGASSALWNLAYDGGMGLGAAGFGVIALHTGYPVAFVLVAVVLAAAILPATLPPRKLKNASPNNPST
jgi:MFS family permease